METRRVWIEHLIRIIDPVLKNMAEEKLKEVMPLKQHEKGVDREYCTYLEALGRILCGIGPWLNLKSENEEESELQEYYRNLVIKSLRHAVNSQSKDFVFTKKEGKFLPQILVDSAFLALGLIRSREKIWDRLDELTKEHIIGYLKDTREVLPYYNNWLLFSAMIEVFLYVVGEKVDVMRIDYAMRQFEAWYVGDGMYSDGNLMHMDYYNSFVIQPFIMEIVTHTENIYKIDDKSKNKYLNRAKRYAQIQEMCICTDGSFSAFGRSITYRQGAFHHLAYMSLIEQLPNELTLAGTRCALTAVIRKCMTIEGTFDEKGWLNIGLFGQQPNLGEYYISIGSLYLCTCVFLPLGLNEKHPFWSLSDEKYTMQKIWSGQDQLADRAME